MIVGGRKPAKLAGTPNLELSSFARRRSKFAEFPFIIGLQPLFPVLISVPQTPPPAMCERNYRLAFLALPLPWESIPQRRLPRQLPLTRSQRLLTPSFSAIQNGLGDPYGEAQCDPGTASEPRHRPSARARQPFGLEPRPRPLAAFRPQASLCGERRAACQLCSPTRPSASGQPDP